MKRLLLLALLVFLAGAQAQDRAEVQLQAAIKTEVFDGNLKAAIEQYKKIVNTAGASRAVKAKALLQLAGCYEKQGNAEARKTFETILKDYADQAAVVSEARLRLNAAANVAAVPRGNTMSIQRLDIDFSQWTDTGTVSPDGRSLAFVGNDDDLSIYDLVQRTSRKLTHRDPKGREWAYAPKWSPDGSRIAFEWLNSGGRWDLHVIDAAGTNDRIVVEGDGGSWSQCGWFPDGKSLLVLMKDAKQEANRLVSISVQDKAIRTIRLNVMNAAYRLSPDGLYLARLTSPANNQQRVLSVAPLAGGNEVEVFREKNSIAFMGWHSDSKSILITSDRSGSNDLWRMAVIAGKPQGEWELVKENIGLANPMGWTREGSLFYVTYHRHTDISLATIDLGNGKLTSAPERINQMHIGASSSPAWSPDGKRLAYLAAKTPSERTHLKSILCVWSLDDKSYHVFVLSQKMGDGYPGIWWSSDSQFVFGAAFGSPTKLIKVNAGTGEISVDDTMDRVNIIGSSGDGNIVYLFRGEMTEQKLYSIAVLSNDLRTGRGTELYRTSPADPRDRRTSWINGTRSPDGKWLAFHEEAGSIQYRTRLILVPTIQGTTSEFSIEGSHTCAPIIWAPDSKHIFYSQNDPELKKREMSELDIDTGKSRKLDQATQTYLLSLSLNPDAKRIAYVTTGEGEEGMWILENLPPLKSTGK